MKTHPWFLLCSLLFVAPLSATQSVYFGLFPSVLVEPYDELDAVEVNLFPFVVGLELSPGVMLELRPLADGQFVAGRAPVLSHLGGTIALRRVLAGESPGVTWHLGGFLSANYNAADGGVVVIAGLEPGVTWTALDRFSLTLAPQPGIDWFPRPGAGQETWLPHFGLVVHMGWSFNTDPIRPASVPAATPGPGAIGFSPPLR